MKAYGNASQLKFVLDGCNPELKHVNKLNTHEHTYFGANVDGQMLMESPL